MTTKNRIITIQEEYFEFCLLLLQKISVEENDVAALASRAHGLKDELKKEIIRYFSDIKTELAEEIEAEIENLKIILKTKPPDN